MSAPAITAPINNASAATFQPLAKLGSEAVSVMISVNIAALMRFSIDRASC